jgi:hypothetical protein
MSVADYILRTGALLLLSTYLLRQQRQREAASPLAERRLPPEWAGQTLDARKLMLATDQVRRNPHRTSRFPAHQIQYKRALLALARVSIEKFHYFSLFRATRH